MNTDTDKKEAIQISSYSLNQSKLPQSSNLANDDLIIHIVISGKVINICQIHLLLSETHHKGMELTQAII